jgi:hypothetical protein
VAGEVIQPLELPTVAVTRDMGDIHALGNPHFLTDPVNGGSSRSISARRSADWMQTGAQPTGPTSRSLSPAWMRSWPNGRSYSRHTVEHALWRITTPGRTSPNGSG